MLVFSPWECVACFKHWLGRLQYDIILRERRPPYPTYKKSTLKGTCMYSKAKRGHCLPHLTEESLISRFWISTRVRTKGLFWWIVLLWMRLGSKNKGIKCWLWKCWEGTTTVGIKWLFGWKRTDLGTTLIPLLYVLSIQGTKDISSTLG